MELLLSALVIIIEESLRSLFKTFVSYDFSIALLGELGTFIVSVLLFFIFSLLKTALRYRAEIFK